ncbi:MAG TPA: HipA domain-containing protein [Steroidobacteraceae bacterium]|nr:HipA domain-containing protein [Steroidobacteraceae bacterium]
MTEAEVWLDDPRLAERLLIGRLFRSLNKGGEAVRFEYSEAWLRHPHSFQIDPEAQLDAGPQYAAAGAHELFGVFSDCSPDRWGKLLMDRREAIEAREQGRRPRALRAWDYLVGVDDTARMGAMRLADAQTHHFVANHPLSAPPMTALRELEAAAIQVEHGQGAQVDKWVRQLLAPGVTLGGARPKASFVDERGDLWLAKFPSADDRHDVGLWEFLAHELAVAAGINMPAAQILELSRHGHTFAVRRFDRVDGHRVMYASARTLLQMDSEAASYLDLVQAIESHGAQGRIAADLEQMFRRAVFNVLVGNRDDHLRNHGFLREKTGWHLSPAFDVNPNPDKDVHVLTLDGHEGTPDTRLLLQNREFFRLSGDRAPQILEEVRTAARSWERRAVAIGINRAEIGMLGAVIDPDR